MYCLDIIDIPAARARQRVTCQWSVFPNAPSSATSPASAATQMWARIRLFMSPMSSQARDERAAQVQDVLLQALCAGHRALDRP